MPTTSTLVKFAESIDKPLGFFVLALLIVESFICVVAGISKFSEDTLFYCLLLGAGLFIYITLIVTFLVKQCPENLTFNQTGHLKRKGGPYGNDKKQVKDIDSLRGTSSGGK